MLVYQRVISNTRSLDHHTSPRGLMVDESAIFEAPKLPASHWPALVVTTWISGGQTIQYWSYPVVNYVHYIANGYSKWFISMLFRIFRMYWWIQYGYDLWVPYMDVNEDDVWTWILTCHEAKPWTNAPHGLVLCPVGWLWNKLSWFCPASGWICNFCSSLCVNGLDWGKILIGNHGF